MSQAYEPTSTTASTGTAASGGAVASIGTLVSAATRDISTLVRDEIELAKTELKADAKAAARGAVLLAIAAVFGLFLLFMLLIAFAEGLVAAGMWRWLAYLVVAIVLMVLAGIAAFIALRSIKKVKPPERTIETTKDTIAWAKKPTQPPAGSLSPAGPSGLPATRR